MRRITSTDLSNWAPTRNCQENLPLLIRRLIRASIDDVKKLMIPAGDNIILPGFDGTVELIKGTEYIPSGKSGWEIGSGINFKGKAQKDFKARTKDVDFTDANEITYVFVTPYVWSKKGEWVNKKKQTDIWKDVVVIDGLILEEWIEQYPHVGVWLSKSLALPVANIQPLDEFWNEWSKSIKFSIPPGLVISGREHEEKEITAFVGGSPRALTIKSFTDKEVIAFFAASVERLNDELKERVYSRAIIVDNEEEFRILISCPNHMILIAKFETNSLVDLAIQNGHHVLIPVSNDITAVKDCIELPWIKRTGFEKGLEEMGFTFDERQQIIRDSGQSLSVLRRLLGFEKNSQPEWAKQGNHIDILPVLLAGMWEEFNENDRKIIELFASKPYEEYVPRLARWITEKDPPIRKIGTLWKITSAFDSWSVLGSFLTETYLQKFTSAFHSVLSEIDPALELQPDKRHLSALYKKTPKYSSSMKQGLCQSLILISVFGEQFKINYHGSLQSFSNKLVKDLLHEATGEKWNSLYDVLPLLSEASPESFLQAIEESLQADDSPILKMFENPGDSFFNRAYYPNLLWALENLLISPVYLLRTTLILAKLDEVAPKGKLVNQPMNSLRETYIPWFGQTQADLALKKTVITTLSRIMPNTCWKLLLGILPNNHNIVGYIHQCKWRFEPQKLKRSVAYEELFDFHSFILDKLLLLATDEEKKAQLISRYPDLSLKEREKLLKFFEESGPPIENSQPFIWDRLRKILARHKEHSEQSWALPPEELNKLEKIFNTLTPKDLKYKYKYLFEEQWPDFPDGAKRRGVSHEDSENYHDNRRLDAFREIYAAEGLVGIFEVVNDLKNINEIARIAAKSTLTPVEEVEILKQLCEDARNSKHQFAQAYIFYKSFNSDSWAVDTWKIIKEISDNEDVYVSFFLPLPQRMNNWQLLETATEYVSNSYWKKVNFWLNQKNVDEKNYVIEKLMAAKRYLALIDETWYFAEEISSKVIFEILRGAATEKTEENSHIDNYHVSKLFEVLHRREDVPKEEMILLEWMYLSFLTGDHGDHKPQNLFSELSNDPYFFVEAIKCLYKPDTGIIEDELSDDQKKVKGIMAENAYQLLHAWREIPGKSGDMIDKKKLMDWISLARERAKQENRTNAVDTNIGTILAHAPRTDNDWPPEEICQIIDELNNKNVLSGFETQIFNSRGVTVRSPYAGGEQERVLAAWFKNAANRIISKYPITASALYNLAKRYEKDAKDEDNRAKLDELR